MSFITPATVQSIANSLDITRISDDAAKALAPDVEYRLREVIQEALKCMRHSRRTVLTAHDVAQALRIQNIEVLCITINNTASCYHHRTQPLHGLSGGDSLRLRRVAGHGDLYYVANRVVTVDQVLQQGLPPPPRDVALSPHWLAIDGVQPKIPPNQPLITQGNAAVAAPDRKRPREPSTIIPERPSKAVPATGTPAAPGATLKLPVRHVVTEELQAYYKRVMSVLDGGWRGEAEASKGARRLLASVLASMAADPGLQPLVPYFVSSAVEGLRQSEPLARAHLQLLLVASLVTNPHLQLELYLHQLMPALLTCALTVGTSNEDQSATPLLHAALREHASSVVARMCRHYVQPVYNLTARTASFALNTLLDAARPLPTQYGCIATLRALGSGVLQVVLLPHAVSLLERYMPEAHESVAQSHAVACRGLLVEAVAQALTAFWAGSRAAIGGVHTRRRRASPAIKSVEEEKSITKEQADDAPQPMVGATPVAAKTALRSTRSATNAGGKPSRGRHRARGAPAAVEEKAGPVEGGGACKGSANGHEGVDEAVLQAPGQGKAGPVEGPLMAAYAHIAEELLAQVPSMEPHAVVFL